MTAKRPSGAWNATPGLEPAGCAQVRSPLREGAFYDGRKGLSTTVVY
jgi:hypothetical protein